MKIHSVRKKRLNIKTLAASLIIACSLLIPALTVFAGDYGFESEGASFVAECLNNYNQLGFSSTYAGLVWNEGENWINNAEALSITVDGNPSWGSVAWFWEGETCRVAWVSIVNSDGTAVIEGMNENGYFEQTPSEGMKFIHFLDAAEDETTGNSENETTGTTSPQTSEQPTTGKETTKPAETQKGQVVINYDLDFTGYMYWPLYGYGVECITSGYGYRTGEYSGFHQGIDIGCPEGTPVYACDAGWVVNAAYSDSAGNYTVIAHEGNIYTEYMHQSKMVVSLGDYVQAGQLIGYVGSTGWSTGSHLHIGVMVGGFGSEYRVNPCEYLGIRNVTVISEQEQTGTTLEWKAIENRLGYCSFYQGDTNAKIIGTAGKEYKYYNYYDILVISVNYKGKQIIGTAAEIFKKTGKKVTFTDDQNYGKNQWTLGEHEVSAKFNGKEYKATVCIVENPIESISAAGISIPAETGGTFMSYYDSTTKKIKNYAFYAYAPTVEKITVTLKEGIEINGSGIIIGTPDEIAGLLGLEDGYSVKTDQSYANPWMPGNVYTADFSFLGFSMDFQVEITETKKLNGQQL